LTPARLAHIAERRIHLTVFAVVGIGLDGVDDALDQIHHVDV
jgi:hypothetical protein